VNETAIASHVEREQEAYNRAMSAARVNDRKAYGLAWAEFVRLHSERPQAVVNEMEQRKGLR
jgi:hypothetical protein